MSEDLILPASLQRLEITPERQDSSSKFEENNPFSVLGSSEDKPECYLENLSLKAVCTKGNCHCNRKKDIKEDDEVMKKLKRTQRRPVLRRSRLNGVLLRAPVLKLGDVKQSTASLTAEKSQNMPDSKTSDSIFSHKTLLREEGSETSPNQSTGKTILRAPVLRVERSLHPINRHSSEECSAQRPPSMCAVQARNPAPDDTNIEELASYFDLFVHIPKKMSVMAEMMYI